MFTDNVRERVRLVELDYDKTNEFIKGVIGTSAALRGSAITLWLALLGFAFQQDLVVLAGLAGVVALVFWVVDGYHGWLYSEAATHLRAVERVLTAYFAALARGDDDQDVITDFGIDLQVHRFGLFLHIRRPNWLTCLLVARPRVVYRGVYPFLLALAGVAAIAIGPLEAGKKENAAVTHNPSAAIVTTLTISQRTYLTKLSIDLRRSRNPENRQLGTYIRELLRGAPGAIASIASLTEAAHSLGERALALLLEAASDAGLSATVGATVNINNSHVDNSRVDNSRVTGPAISFGSPTPANGRVQVQRATECLTYLVQLDDLVDDDSGIVGLLPASLFPAKECGGKSVDELVTRLAKR
jgi:hypothetical protein